MKTTRTPPAFCPFCFHLLDATSPLKDDHVPQPGDFAICLYCAGVLKFGDDMGRLPSSLMDIPIHSRKAFAEAVTAAKQLIELRRQRGEQR